MTIYTFLQRLRNYRAFEESRLVHERIGLNGGGAVDVLDEQDFVADLVVEKLVDGASGEEKTEAAGW